MVPVAAGVCRRVHLSELHGVSRWHWASASGGISLKPSSISLWVCSFFSIGRLTQRSRSDGSVSPYEANIALFELFRGDVGGEDQSWQVERFLLSQAVMLAF